jgi:hypothetical protein
MSDEQAVVQPETEQKPLEIEVEPQVAFNLKLQEFDKAIATAEAQVYDLKKQKMSFVYDRNVQLLTEAAMAKKKKEEEGEIVEAEATPVTGA